MFKNKIITTRVSGQLAKEALKNLKLRMLVRVVGIIKYEKATQSYILEAEYIEYKKIENDNIEVVSLK